MTIYQWMSDGQLPEYELNEEVQLSQLEEFSFLNPDHHDTYKMAEENLPAPTRSDEQLVPAKARLPYEKSNFLLELQKLQKNPIFRISVDILQNTNFFRAFSASANWFTLNFDLLRDALEITPVDPANPFVSPSAGEVVMDFINELGNDKPRHPVLKMLWGIVTRTNVDYAELLWEEFVQGIHTFFTHRDSNKISSKKPTPQVIPYCRFTKLIIYYLGSKYNIHRRPESPRHLSKGLSTIRNMWRWQKGGKKKTAPKIDKHVKPAPAKQSKPATSKQPKPKPVKEKSTKPTPLQKADKGKVMKFCKGKSPLQLIDEEEEAEHEPEPEPQGKGEEYDVERAIQMSLESFQAQGQAHVGGVAIRELVAEATRPLPVVEGKGKAIRWIPVTEEASTGPSAQPKDDTSANIVRETPSPTYAETGATTDKTNSEGDIEILNIGEEQGEDVADKVNLEEKTVKIDESQARSDPGKTPESQPPPERVLMEEDRAGPDPGQSHVALAGPDPEPMHDDFVATISIGTLSSMKNLDAYTYGDQFFNDKPTEEDPEKTNMETEVEFMVNVPIHQASSSVPPLSTPVINPSTTKPVSSPAQAVTPPSYDTQRNTTFGVLLHNTCTRDEIMSEKYATSQRIQTSDRVVKPNKSI
ncbi:hypothetical protein Tco_0360218 [Tanacetum coccineum]